MTPTQRAFTFATQKSIDRLNERARNLFADGYTVDPTGVDGEFYVYNGKPYELPYTVDFVKRTCTCPFCQNQKEEPLVDGGFVECKHWRGLSFLITAQMEQLQAEAEEAFQNEEHQLERRLLESLRQLRAA